MVNGLLLFSALVTSGHSKHLHTILPNIHTQPIRTSLVKVTRVNTRPRGAGDWTSALPVTSQPVLPSELHAARKESNVHLFLLIPADQAGFRFSQAAPQRGSGGGGLHRLCVHSSGEQGARADRAPEGGQEDQKVIHTLGPSLFRLHLPYTLHRRYRRHFFSHFFFLWWSNRGDIPAMYNNLDASLDTTAFTQYTQSQEDSTLVSANRTNANLVNSLVDALSKTLTYFHPQREVNCRTTQKCWGVPCQGTKTLKVQH